MYPHFKDSNSQIKSLIDNNYNQNDYEKIAIKENVEMNQLIKYLSNTYKCIFARMTGSGSCCYATYEKQDFAIKAQKNIKENFPQYWSFAGENDIT